MASHTNQIDAVNWALAYPFDVPGNSFVYLDGEILALSGWRGGNWSLTQVQKDNRQVTLQEAAALCGLSAVQFEQERVPVIACGSNASPQRLRQKYLRDLPGSIVPTVKARMKNYAVVYAAKFTEYGSMPATLAYAPGTVTEIFVNFLMAEQLRLMDGTETLGISYVRPILDDTRIELESGDVIEQCFAYISLHGCFTPAGQPVTLNTVKSVDNGFTSIGQHQVQTLAKDNLESGNGLEEFIFENISDHVLRKERSKILSERHSIPAGYSDTETVRIGYV